MQPVQPKQPLTETYCVSDTTLGLQWVRDGWVASVGVEAGSCFDGSALPCGFSCNKYRPFMCEPFFFLVLLWSSRWGFYWQADHRGMEYAGSPVCWILCLVLLGCGVLWFFFFFNHLYASDPGPILSVCQPPRPDYCLCPSGLPQCRFQPNSLLLTYPLGPLPVWDFCLCPSFHRPSLLFA